MKKLLVFWRMYRISKQHKDIVGFWTLAEWAAYEKGREDEEKVLVKFIENWDGSTNSAMGQLLHDIVLKNFKELNTN